MEKENVQKGFRLSLPFCSGNTGSYESYLPTYSPNRAPFVDSFGLFSGHPVQSGLAFQSLSNPEAQHSYVQSDSRCWTRIADESDSIVLRDTSINTRCIDRIQRLKHFGSKTASWEYKYTGGRLLHSSIHPSVRLVASTYPNCGNNTRQHRT